jgi:hypothetical protein
MWRFAPVPHRVMLECPDARGHDVLLDDGRFFNTLSVLLNSSTQTQR